jgi:hypothetical protein
MTGRPSTYTPEIGKAICDALAAHDGGLRSLCKSRDDFPEPNTIYTWRSRFPDFDDQFAHARQKQLQMMAEDIVDISQDETLDPQARRLMVDTRKWLLSKLMHRTYGDKLDVTSGGETLNTSNAMLVDQRVQSIIMQAQARRADHELPELDANALKLLD